MGKKLIQKLEQLDLETEGTLCKSSVKERDGSTIGPKSYMLISFPKGIIEKLGEEAVESGYRPGQKVKYKITIKRID